MTQKKRLKWETKKMHELEQSDLNRWCEVHWSDPKTCTRMTLADCLSRGYGKAKSRGTLHYFDETCVVICSEIIDAKTDEELLDLTMVPPAIVTRIKFLKEV